jgi:putative hydrolase of the HAD superfamily
LQEYLDRVVFYTERSFTHEQFRDFMFAQSEAYPDMIDLIKRLKAKYRLKIALVNNEGRELNSYRIHTFGLNTFVDFFISSCFVHFRKPDADIFRIALDIAQVSPEQVVYFEDRPMFISVASDLGIKGICHHGYENTLLALQNLGFEI